MLKVYNTVSTSTVYLETFHTETDCFQWGHLKQAKRGEKNAEDKEEKLLKIVALARIEIREDKGYKPL